MIRPPKHRVDCPGALDPNQADPLGCRGCEWLEEAAGLGNELIERGDERLVGRVTWDRDLALTLQALRRLSQ